MDKQIVVVSGLPRSGTSMMVNMLMAGGMVVATDNIRKPDDDNPRGYYEYERVKMIKDDSSCLDDVHGKVVKMVSMLLYHLSFDKNYKVIFMKRNMKEVLASQRKMLERSGVQDDTGDEEMEGLYTKHLGEIEKWLSEQSSIEVAYVVYNDVIKNPVENARRVNEFLGRGLQVDEMAKVVDESLYRNRK